MLGGVERDVEARDAGVGRGQMLVLRGTDVDGRHGLESLFAGRQGRTGRPEVHQVLALGVGHLLHHGPEPSLEASHALRSLSTLVVEGGV